MQNTNKNKAKKIFSSASNKNLKGQAAIEFLVTYGWAILGVLITIGTLSYFGIFNTQRYVNDVCYFGDQMTCEDYIAYQNGSVSLQFRNNFGTPININSTIIKSDYGTVKCNNTGDIPVAAVQSSSTFKINCRITTLSVPTNSKLKYKATITFNGSANLHNQTGDVTVTVQK